MYILIDICMESRYRIAEKEVTPVEYLEQYVERMMSDGWECLGPPQLAQLRDDLDGNKRLHLYQAMIKRQQL